MNGLIIIGYPGIGKSSVGMMNSINQNIIDFESSLFKVYGARANNWHVIYCRQAVSLARQGFIVCISSHKCVREELAKCAQDGFSVVTITPSPKLKEEWIARLKDRYLQDPSEKNILALQNAENSYDEDIKDIASDPNFSHIYLESINYHLRSIVNNHVSVEETCPTCFGKGTIKSSILFTDQLESKIANLVNKIGVKKFYLHVHPYVAAYINQGFISLKRRWQMKYGMGVRIISSQKLAFLQYEFYDANKQFIDMKEEIETK